MTDQAPPVESQSKQGSERIRWRDIKRFCRFHGIPRPGDMAHPGHAAWPFDAWTTKHPEFVTLIKAKMTGAKQEGRA